MKKGQQEILTTILITGILVGIVGTVLFWGFPLIQKSKDASTLETSEGFIRAINNKIKFIANNGGKDQLVISIPGTVKFLPAEGQIELLVDTQGTVYATDAEIPIGRNECSRVEGTWGINDPEVVCLTSKKIDTNRYLTTYRLGYIPLKTQGVVAYKISMTGETGIGGEGHTIIFENTGTQENENTINTIVSISIA